MIEVIEAIVGSYQSVKAVEFPLLGQVAVAVPVEIDNLAGPLAVEEAAISNLEPTSLPCGNFVKQSPLLGSEAWLLESSVPDDVFVGSVPDQVDIVNGESVAVGVPGTCDLEHVDSLFGLDCDCKPVDAVVGGLEDSNIMTIPVDDSLA